MRDLTEELSGVKCKTIKDFSDDSCKFSDICHCHTCPQLGPNKAAMRRFPCNCEACDEAINKPWVNAIKEPAKQPRFANATGCFFKPLLEDKNEWHFVELQERVGSDEDEVDEERQLVLRHVTTSVARSIEVGKIGAVAFQQHEGDSSEEGHHLVEFAGLPRTEQDELSSGCAWKVDCKWLNSVPRARHWCTKSEQEATVDLVHVVAADVEMIPMSPTNMIKNRAVRQEAEKLKAMKIAEESHEFILDEISRRERLEHDPSRVFVAADEDSESDED